MWAKMGFNVWSATELGPLMEAEAEGLIVSIPYHRWAGVGL